MENDKTLSIFQEPQTFELDDVFTCEKCDFAICENIARCPKCNHRMLNPTEEKVRSETFSSGIYFIVIGIIYSIFPVISIIRNDLSFYQLFEKASSTDVMSVSRFTSMFLFTFCFLGIGGVSIIFKKDSLSVRLITGGIIIAICMVADYFIPKFSN